MYPGKTVVPYEMSNILLYNIPLMVCVFVFRKIHVVMDSKELQFYIIMYCEYHQNEILLAKDHIMSLAYW